MLRDRHEPLNLFDLVPTLGMTMEPVLARLDTLLDDDTLFQAVKADLARRRPRTRIDGRPSTPVEVILRMLVVKHLYGWSYAQTERWVADSLVLRQFCRVYAERVPDDTTLSRWANLIQPATLHTLLDHIVGLARQLKVTRGRAVFKRPPRLLAGDRGLHSPTNERYATAQGIAQVVLPKPGAKSAKRVAHEQQRWFRRGHDWRSGIEGRISGLKRRHKLDRCRNHGTDGMERWVGWGIIAHDLRVIAAATTR